MDKINASPSPSTTAEAGNAVAPLGTPEEIRGKLALLGWKSLAAWGEAHGYSLKMPHYVVKTWGHTTKRPHGGIARHLMQNLRETLETSRRPEHLAQSREH